MTIPLRSPEEAAREHAPHLWSRCENYHAFKEGEFERYLAALLRADREAVREECLSVVYHIHHVWNIHPNAAKEIASAIRAGGERP